MISRSSLKRAAISIDYGLTASAIDSGEGPKFLRITDIDRSFISWKDVPRCTASARDQEKYRLATGDVVVARTGASTGRSQWVQVEETAVFASYLVRFRFGTDFDSRFMGYVLNSKPWHEYVLGLAHGKSAQPNMSASDMAAFEFEHPARHEQRAIAEVLGALDDKIAANTKLAATADELIRTQFASLETESMAPLGELADQRRTGVDPSGIDEDTPYVGLEHIPRRSVWLFESGKAANVTSGKSQFRAGDVLFGKLRPYFHKVVSADMDGICSTDVIVLTSRRVELAGFVLAAASSDSVVQAVTASSEGTRMPRTSWKDLSSVDVPWPGDKAAIAFSRGVGSLASTVQSLVRENRTLAATRDALLPQLMSGKLRVHDAERQVGEVA